MKTKIQKTKKSPSGIHWPGKNHPGSPHFFQAKILLFTILFAFGIVFHGFAQTYVSNSGSAGGSNSFPFNASSGGSGSKVELNYAPGDFSSLPRAGKITKVYFRLNAAVSSTYSNFTIAMTQVSSISGSTSFSTGMTTVYGPATTTINCPSGGSWCGVSLSTPFAYDSTKILVVMVQQNAITSGGNTINTSSGSILSKYRIYGSYGSSSGNGTDGSKYDFGFDVQSCTSSSPAIALSGNSTTIANGQTTTSASDYTDFGNTDLGTPVSHSFQIANNGGSDLTLGTITLTGANASDYSLTSAPTTIAASSTGTVTVSFNPSASHTRSATLNIPSNACASSSFSFALSGFGNAGSPLHGTYTVGASGSNYASISAAAAAVVDRGVDGAVTFQVASGTYNETVSIGAINGTSATNTVTFKGGGRGNTILTNSGITLQMIGCSYVTFDGLRINSTATTAAACSTTVNCSIINCDINSGSTSTYCLSDNSTLNMVVQNCHITGGYYGVYIYSQTPSTTMANNKYINNRITNFNTYGLYANNTNAATYTGNVFDTLLNSFGGYGIYSYFESGPDYERNTVLANHTYYPMMFYYPNYYSSAKQAVLVNNFLSGTYQYYTYMYLYYSSNVLIAHNTFYNVTATTNFGIYCYGNNTANSNVKFMNNLIVGRTSSSLAYVYNLTTTNGIIDGNDFVNLGSGGIAQTENGTYSTLAAYKSAMSGHTYTSLYDNSTQSFESHAQNLNPTFVNPPSNLRLSLSGNLPKGVYAGIDLDFDGNIRDHAAPFAGAYECTPTAFTACATNITTNTVGNTCAATAAYTCTASGNPTYTYTFSGATSGSGSGTGSGATFAKGVTSVAVTAVNNCGTATCNFTVTVIDNVLPVALAKNATIYLNTSGTATLATTDIDNGSNDNCGSVTIGLDKTSFNCSNTGANTVTLTATDPSGNRASATATVTVLDTTRPIAQAKNLTLYLNGSGAASITEGSVINAVYDNCGVSTITLDKYAFDCSNTGANYDTLRVTDNSGNVSKAQSVITVRDTIKPVARVKNITVNLDASGAASITPSSIDNGTTDNCSVSLSINKNNFSCSDIGANAVTLTATDPSANQASATATVTVRDNTAPTVLTQNITVYLDNSGAATVTTAQIDNGTTDNCSVASMNLDKTSFNCSNVGPNTVKLTAYDPSGNNAFATAVVTVRDTTPPTVRVNDITVILNLANTVSITVAQINNGSTDNCTITSMVLDKSSFNCSNVGVNNVKLTVTDNSGNVAFAIAKVTVRDTIKPVAKAKNIIVYLDATGNINVPGTSVNNASTDNCGIVSYTLSQSDFSCSDIGVKTVTLTVADAGGNTSSATCTITVKDSMKPVLHLLGSYNVYLNASGAATLNASQLDNGTTDNCSYILAFNTTGTITSKAYTCTNAGSVTLTVYAIDPTKNYSSGTITVQIKDTTHPIAIAKDITLNLSATTGTVALLATAVDNGSSDNCSITTRTVSVSSFDCSKVGVNDVTFTVSDAAGNTSSAVAHVTVKDITAPKLLKKNVTAYLNASGVARITPADINNGSTDNCSIASITLSKDSFTCANKGNNTVTITLTDPSGNVTSGTATVTVADVIKPVAVAKNVTLYLDATGKAVLTPSMIDNGSSDNCSVALSIYNNGVTATSVTFTCGTLGVHADSLKATDPSGNYKSASAIVTVLDSTKPTVITKNITVAIPTAGTVTITPAQVNNLSKDNCSIATMTLDKTSFNCTNVGDNVVTLTLTDPSGNTSSATAIVTVTTTLRVPAIADQTVYYGYAPLASATLTAKPTGGFKPYAYRWSTSATTAAITASPTTDTRYKVTVTDVNGCTALTTAYVYVNDVRCGSDSTKVTMCHNGNTICTDATTVTYNLGHYSNDYLGSCVQGKVGKMAQNGDGTLEVFPNPFTGSTRVAFSPAINQEILLEVYDLSGNQIQTLYQGQVNANDPYFFNLNSENMAAGMYFVRLTTQDHVKFVKIVKN